MFCYGSRSKLTQALRKPACNIPVALPPPPGLENSLPQDGFGLADFLFVMFQVIFFFDKKLTSEISVGGALFVPLLFFSFVLCRFYR